MLLTKMKSNEHHQHAGSSSDFNTSNNANVNKNKLMDRKKSKVPVERSMIDGDMASRQKTHDNIYIAA